MDIKSTRLFLYANRTDAAALLLYTNAVFALLPTWLGHRTDAVLDVTDVERLTSRCPPNPTQEQQPDRIDLTADDDSSTPPTPPQALGAAPSSTPLPDTMNITRQEWTAAMTYMKMMNDKVDRIMSLLHPTPPVTCTTGLDEVVSAITQCITTTSDSICAHNTNIIATTQDSLSKQMDDYAGTMVQLCTDTTTRNNKFAAHLMEVMQNLSTLVHNI